MEVLKRRAESQNPVSANTTALLRREDLPTIDIATKEKVCRVLETLGYDQNNVFLKLVYAIPGSLAAYKIWDDGTTSRLSTLEINPIDEVDQLLRLHKLSPQNVVRPIALARSSRTGQPPIVVGYFMEFVKGTSLYEIGEGSLPLKRKIFPWAVKNVVEIMAHLHSNWVGHGDLRHQNILVTPAPAITLIDPLPTGYGYPSQEALICVDKIVLKGMQYEYELLRLRIG